MTKQTTTSVIAFIVWIFAEAVLQIHGIRFWSEYGGWNGWIWSVVLGVITVWFWLHHIRVVRLLLGGVASLLLVAGPLYHVGYPIIDKVNQVHASVESSQVEIKSLKRSELEMVNQLGTYLGNSEERSGWAPIIVQVQNRLDQNRDRQIQLSVKSVSGSHWLPIAVVLIQLTTLIVMQAAAVSSLYVLRKNVLNVSVKQDRPKIKTQNTVKAKKQNVPLKKKSDIDIKKLITSGGYGNKPAIRNVIIKERINHPKAKQIFGELVSDGVLVVNGNRYALKGE